MKTTELKAKGFTINNGVLTSPSGQRSIVCHTIYGPLNAVANFLSCDHCQRVPGVLTVPTSFYLPQQVAPRKGLESGIVDSLESWRFVYGDDGVPFIPNPDPDYSVE